MFTKVGLIRYLGISLLLPCLSAGLEIDSLFLKSTDSIFSDYTQETATRVEVHKGKRIRFMAFTVRTMDHPFEKVAGLLLDTRRYAEQSKKLKQHELIDSSSADTSTWFLVFGNWFAGSWFVGKVYKSYLSSGDEMFVMNRMVHNGKWREKYRKVVKGWMKVGYHDYLMWTRLRKIDRSRTRVAMVSFVEPTIRVPAWLNKLASKRIFPGILREVDEILDKSGKR